MATLATFSGLIRMDDVVIPETLRGPGGFSKYTCHHMHKFDFFHLFPFPFFRFLGPEKGQENMET